DKAAKLDHTALTIDVGDCRGALRGSRSRGFGGNISRQDLRGCRRCRRCDSRLRRTGLRRRGTGAECEQQRCKCRSPQTRGARQAAEYDGFVHATLLQKSTVFMLNTAFSMMMMIPPTMTPSRTIRVGCKALTRRVI